jgi:hypothetical protein
MRRTLLTLSVLGTLIVPAAATAGGPQSSDTQVRAVKVFQVGGHVKVDVIVAHPDAKAHALPRKARNTGTARITLRAADGAVLATHSARAALPVSVPRARQVLQTYRFALEPAVGAQIASAGTVNVSVVAESSLDPDGSGPAAPATDRDTATADVAIEDVDAEAPLSHYVDIGFGTGRSCDIDSDDCGAYFDFRSLPGPFHDETGDVRIKPSGGRTTIWFGRSTQFLEGFVSSMASDRFEITNGIVIPWGIGKITSAPRDAGTPGKPGGPLALDVEREWTGRHDWHVWGYVNIAVSDQRGTSQSLSPFSVRS